jgi:AsmA protein
VHLGTLQADLSGGRCRGDISLDARGSEAQLAVQAHLEGIDVGALTQALSGSARLSGQALAEGNFSGAGNTDAALRAALAGRFSATVTGGAVQGVDLLYEIKRAQALLKGEPPPARSGPERTVFRQLTTHGTLAGNVVHDDELHAATEFLTVQGGGTYDLAGGAVDYHLTAQLSGAAPAAGSLAALANAAVPIRITGKLGALSVRPDLEELARAQAREELGRRLGKEQDQVKQKLNETLQQLFKH